MEKAFGMHAFETVNNLHNYVILYLNRLIHGLIRAGNKFHKNIGSQ